MIMLLVSILFYAFGFSIGGKISGKSKKKGH
jgi:hypothetical protein